MPRSGGGRGEQASTPKSFAETTPPPSGADLSMWLVGAVTRNSEALGKVEGTLVGLQAQMDRMEGKLDAIKTNVEGHGKWIHTLKIALTGIGIVLAWAVVYGLGPWVTAKFFSGK